MRYLKDTAKALTPFKPIPLSPVKEDSFWDKYKWIIIGIIAGGIVLILIIIIFYFLQRRSYSIE